MKVVWFKTGVLSTTAQICVVVLYWSGMCAVRVQQHQTFFVVPRYEYKYLSSSTELSMVPGTSTTGSSEDISTSRLFGWNSIPFLDPHSGTCNFNFLDMFHVPT
jgi:hypothetical protein